VNDLFSTAYDEPTNRRLKWLAPLLLLLVTAVIYLPGTSLLPLLDRDEPRFSQATVEMMERGEWFIPYFNDEYRFDKPVLIYWLMRGGYTLAGKNEFGARLPSVAAVFCCALAICVLGTRMFSPACGMLAGLAWLTSLQVFIHGRIAVADMVMVLFVILAHLSLWELLLSGRRYQPWSRFFWLLWLSLGLGFLTKGPIGVLVPLLSLVGFRVMLWRQPLNWAPLQWPAGIVLSLLIIGAWGIPALINTGGAFWQVGIGTHVVDRGMEAFNGRIPIPGYYFLTALFSLFPWIVFGWRAYRNGCSPFDADTAFLFSWLLNPYLIFLFYKTQLPHYVMPGFGAFFLLLFRHGFCPDFSRGERRWFYAVGGIWALVILAVGAILLIFPFSGGLAPLNRFGWALLLMLAAMWLFVVLLFVISGSGVRRDVFFFGMVAIMGLAVSVGASALRSVHATVAIVDRVSEVPPRTAKLAYGFTEPSLVYYTGAGWQMNPPYHPSLVLAEAGEEMPIMVIQMREWNLEHYFANLRAGIDTATPKRDRSAEYEPLAKMARAMGYRVETIHGMNFGSTSWVELALFIPPALVEP
jgi:4-amino-4-deoxy-L-arabinose transferase-like glycosyltransferase